MKIKCRRCSRLYKKLKVGHCATNETNLTDFVPQRQRAAWSTTPLGLVSHITHWSPSLLTNFWYSARLLSFFGKTAWKLLSMVDSSTCSAHWRFMYFHGQRHARLSNDQTVYSKPIRERSTLISLLSPLLFLAPEVHLGEMEKLWTDEVIIEIAWKSFMKKLLDEWNSFIFLVRFMPCRN